LPLIIGGATTSKLHTALKIAPVYKASVAYVRDASQVAPVASQLINPTLKDEYRKKLYSEYETLCNEHSEKTIRTTPLDEARKNKLNLF
jgi:Methionine synthase I, cobalamin-binding domain